MRGSAVGIATGYGLDDRGVGVRVNLSISFRPALGSTQAPIKCVPGMLSPGGSGRGVKLSNHL
jgi:hypothetical protein